MKAFRWSILATAIGLAAALSPALQAYEPASADGPWIGTWKKRVEGPDAADPPTLSMWLLRDGFAYTLHMKSRSGQAAQMGAIARFDGEPHVEKGNDAADHNVFERIDDHTYSLIDMKNGKPNIRFKVTYSPDGNTRTSVATMTNEKGQEVTSTGVWDRVQPESPSSPQGPWIGKWKRNSQESTGHPPPAVFHMWVDRDGFQHAIGSTTKMGEPAFGRFDDKPYPEKGNPAVDANVFRRVDDHTYSLNIVKGGQVINRLLISVTPDGKTRTSVSRSRTPEGGEKVNIGVWNRIE